MKSVNVKSSVDKLKNAGKGMMNGGGGINGGGKPPFDEFKKIVVGGLQKLKSFPKKVLKEYNA